MKDTGKKCTNCGYSNHETKDCRMPKKNTVNIAAANTGSDSCPMCKGSHTWRDRKTGKVNNCTRLASCPKYINLSVEDWADRLRTLQGCAMCTDRTGKNKAAECPVKTKAWVKPCTLLDKSGKPCGKMHHKTLHGSVSAYVNMLRVLTAASSSNDELTSTE